jgi:hypothetical protein
MHVGLLVVVMASRRWHVAGLNLQVCIWGRGFKQERGRMGAGGGVGGSWGQGERGWTILM